MSKKSDNIAWYGMVAFFIGGGAIVLIGSTLITELRSMSILYILISIMSISVGIFLIWLNKNYYLGAEIEITYSDGSKRIIREY